MITTYSATDFVNMSGNTQAHKTKNTMPADNFAQSLKKEMAEDDCSTVVKGAEEDIPELETAEYDEMDIIKEKGLVAYIMELHARRVREEVMERLGVTEGELAEMPSEQRSAIEKRIAEETKKRLEAESYMQKNNNKPNAIQTGNILELLNGGVEPKIEEIKNNSLFHTTDKDKRGSIFS